jgi:hypothetical protein
MNVWYLLKLRKKSEVLFIKNMNYLKKLKQSTPYHNNNNNNNNQ